MECHGGDDSGQSTSESRDGVVASVGLNMNAHASEIFKFHRIDTNKTVGVTIPLSRREGTLTLSATASRIEIKRGRGAYIGIGRRQTHTMNGEIAIHA